MRSTLQPVQTTQSRSQSPLPGVQWTLLAQTNTPHARKTTPQSVRSGLHAVLSCLHDEQSCLHDEQSCSHDDPTSRQALRTTSLGEDCGQHGLKTVAHEPQATRDGDPMTAENEMRLSPGVHERTLRGWYKKPGMDTRSKKNSTTGAAAAPAESETPR